MPWTKENNPHTQGTNKKATKKAKPDTSRFLYKGVKQVGDVRLFNDKNVQSIDFQDDSQLGNVGPLDIVDDVDPKQRYTFHLFDPAQTDHAARELDRLRRAGYVKCVTPRFISVTQRYETRDGVLVLGRGIWYACPEARLQANREKSRNDPRNSALAIANAYSSLAEKGRTEGYEATAQTRSDLRGQRK